MRKSTSAFNYFDASPGLSPVKTVQGKYANSSASFPLSKS
jgi:hypothetical protein